jgi:hypothetical protein
MISEYNLSLLSRPWNGKPKLKRKTQNISWINDPTIPTFKLMVKILKYYPITHYRVIFLLTKQVIICINSISIN